VTVTTPLDPSRNLGTDKVVAMLLLSIDEEVAAKVLRNLSDDGVDRVTRAMQELQEMAIDRDTIWRVYQTVVQRMRQGGMALGDVSGLMRSVLTRAFGEQRSSDVTKRANGEILAKRPFAMFEALTAEDLAKLLTEEHPQIAAVFVAHLDRKKGGEVLNQLDEELRADIVLRVATMDRTPADVVQRVLDVMRKKVKDLGLVSLRGEPKAWVKAAASLLNNLGGGERSVLERIEEADASIAGAIRDQMFTFEDLGKLDRKSMQRVLSAVDSRQLALALKAAIPSVEQAILGNLSKRATDLVQEERDSLGPTPLSEVLAAQTGIVRLIRDLMDRGDIRAPNAVEQMI
jgi:flagellar motor switch protein FliG